MKSLSLLAIASLASAFCSHGTTLFPRSANGAPISDFNYDALTGPLNWAGLDTATTHICSLGKTQSPINIVTKDYTPTSGSTLNFAVENYPDGAEIENLGSTLEVIVNGSLTVKGKEYSLKQFHFHTPSEHRLDDEYFPMEAHFVFQADDKSISVVGVLMEVAEPLDGWPLFDQVFAHLQDVSDPGSVGQTGALDFRMLEQHMGMSNVIQYEGSLTTPPCSEGVSWTVVQDPVHIGLETFLKVKKVLKFNARYTQNVPGGINLLDNARNVLDSGEPARI